MLQVIARKIFDLSQSSIPPANMPEVVQLTIKGTGGPDWHIDCYQQEGNNGKNEIHHIQTTLTSSYIQLI